MLASVARTSQDIVPVGVGGDREVSELDQASCLLTSFQAKSAIEDIIKTVLQR